MSTRRELITLLGGAGLLCVANARRARAQPAAMPVIGYVGPADARWAWGAALHRGVWRGTRGCRLHRREKRRDRIPRGGRTQRAPARPDRRSGPPPSRCYRRERRRGDIGGER